ncbi:MAG: hypothetical protein R2824_24535 [Saprospiraceae bacterium]|nr:hypothetical protein [Lewinella sp.]
MTNRFLPVILSGIIMLVQACTNTFTFEHQLWDCATEEHRILCHRQALARETDAVWDRVVGQLDQQLPADMPNDEKRNMLAVRNANLIRMFEVYQFLNDSIKQTVDQAAQADRQIVTTLNGLQSQLEALEQKKRALFLQIEQSSVDLPAYKAQYEALVSGACE